MPALAIEGQKWMVHVLMVMAVVEETFLLSVDGIIGCVEVQQHLLWSTARRALSEINLEEYMEHSVTATNVHSVLQAREGGVACRILAALGKRDAH